MQISSRRKINNNINYVYWAVPMCRHCTKRFTQVISDLSHNHHNRPTTIIILQTRRTGPPRLKSVCWRAYSGQWGSWDETQKPGLKAHLFTATLNNLPGCFHSFHFIPAVLCHMLWSKCNSVRYKLCIWRTNRQVEMLRPVEMFNNKHLNRTSYYYVPGTAPKLIIYINWLLSFLVDSIIVSSL